MKLKEAIILAGGLGTRLRSAVPDLPKCMAPVNGKPFLAYVIDHLQQQGIEKFVFSLGFKHDVIENYIKHHYSFPALFVIEKDPLGTGGAIKLACENVTGENVLALNGDTLFKINITALASLHAQQMADCTLTLKPMKAFDRYGVVEINADGAIQRFREKQFYEEGLINGGVYVLQVQSFLQEKLPQAFSFEKDYLEQLYSKRKMYGLVQDEYFIDIGIPEDYEKAQREVRS